MISTSLFFNILFLIYLLHFFIRRIKYFKRIKVFLYKKEIRIWLFLIIGLDIFAWVISPILYFYKLVPFEFFQLIIMIFVIAIIILNEIAIYRSKNWGL